MWKSFEPKDHRLHVLDYLEHATRGKSLVSNDANLHTARALQQRSTVLRCGTRNTQSCAPSARAKNCLQNLAHKNYKYGAIYLHYKRQTRRCAAEVYLAAKLLKRGGVVAITVPKNSDLAELTSLTDNISLQQTFEPPTTPNIITMLFSDTNIPPFGPKPGTIVRVRANVVAKVETITSGGVVLRRMRKRKHVWECTQQKFKVHVVHILGKRVPPPRFPRHTRVKKLRRRKRRCPHVKNLRVGQNVAVLDAGVTWPATVIKKTGLDLNSVVVRYSPLCGKWALAYETVHNLSRIKN
jgi:hypothetical protein